MNVTIRLYKLHDYDLLYLYKNLKFPIGIALKKTLEAYVRKEAIFFNYPINKTVIENDILDKVKNSQLHIKLNDITDRDIIIFLSKLKKNYRNSFLKSLLRGSFLGPISYVYNNEIEKEEDIENENILKKKYREIINKENIINIEDLVIKKEKREKRIKEDKKMKALRELAEKL